MYCLAPAFLPTSAAAPAPQSTQKLITAKWKLQQKALLDNQLTKADVLVLNFLLEKFSRTYKNTLIGYVRMAEALNLGLRTVKKAVKKLIIRGYIRKNYQGGRTKPGGRKLANIYSFQFDLISGWTPGWCDPKEKALSRDFKTVHRPAPLIVQTVHRSAPFAGERVHGYAPLPIFLKTPIYQKTTTPLSDHQENSCCRQSPPSQKEIFPDEQEYIDLEVERAQKAGEIRKSPGAYRGGLIQKAKAGTLDISGLDALRAQKRALRIKSLDLSWISKDQAIQIGQEALQGKGACLEDGKGQLDLTAQETIQVIEARFPQAMQEVYLEKEEQKSQVLANEQEGVRVKVQEMLDAGHTGRSICRKWAWGELDLGPQGLAQKTLQAMFPKDLKLELRIRQTYMHAAFQKDKPALRHRFDQKVEELLELAPELARGLRELGTCMA
jgi:predicted transcriptional regulator